MISADVSHLMNIVIQNIYKYKYSVYCGKYHCFLPHDNPFPPNFAAYTADVRKTQRRLL